MKNRVLHIVAKAYRLAPVGVPFFLALVGVPF